MFSKNELVQSTLVYIGCFLAATAGTFPYIPVATLSVKSKSLGMLLPFVCRGMIVCARKNPYFSSVDRHRTSWSTEGVSLSPIWSVRSQRFISYRQCFLSKLQCEGFLRTLRLRTVAFNLTDRPSCFNFQHFRRDFFSELFSYFFLLKIEKWVSFIFNVLVVALDLWKRSSWLFILFSVALIFFCCCWLPRLMSEVGL